MFIVLSREAKEFLQAHDISENSFLGAIRSSVVEITDGKDSSAAMFRVEASGLQLLVMVEHEGESCEVMQITDQFFWTRERG